MYLAPVRFLCRSAGDCTWSIALELQAILVGNVADWSFQIMGSSAVFKCQNTLNTAHPLGTYHCIYNYCLITCNIKSLLNVPKISHISRKISQVSRFPAKSPDSRKKFVFLPKQPLLELSPPYAMQIHIARQTSSKLIRFAKPNQRRAFAKLNSRIKSTKHETGVKQDNEISSRANSYVSFGAIHK